MILANGNVVCEDGIVRVCDIGITGGRITAIGNDLSGKERVDIDGMTVMPGFIDTHIHGGFGVGVEDERPDLSYLRKMEATKGVTSLALGTVGAEWELLLRQLELIADNAALDVGARVLGIHSEPPFITANGAFVSSMILPPDVSRLAEMQKRSRGLLKIITVAPECYGAEELIRYASEHGITVSLGHTNANYEEAMRGIEAGATRATHTFNAMRPLHHREPGVVGAVLTDSRVCCEAICDHIHLHPATLKLIYKCKGADGMIAVSDSVRAAGGGISEFFVQGRRCIIRDGVIRLEDGTICGSALTLLEGVQNLIRAGIPLGDVAKIASLNAAIHLGVDADYGSISIGKLADLVILDGDLSVRATYIGGKLVYVRGEQI